MTTSLHKSTLTLSEPSDLLAAVPALLGFCPTESLVLLTVRSLSPTPRLDLTVRFDLPEPPGYRSLLDYVFQGPALRQHVEAVVIVVVGGTGASPPGAAAFLGEAEADEESPSWADDRRPVPHHELVRALHQRLTSRGVDVLHALWTAEISAGERWECYVDDDCHGRIGDPKASALTATLAAQGTITYSSREELHSLLARESSELVAERAARLDLLHEQRNAEGSGQVHADLDTVLGAIRRTAQGSALTEDDHLAVLRSLADTRVRDLALSTALGPTARAAEELWIALIRKAPDPEIADVAALLAFSAYLRGDGALAGIALEKGEECRPDHALGQLLRQALDAALPPGQLAVVARDAADDAQHLIDEEGAW